MLPVDDSGTDRVLVCYVFDLLSDADSFALIDEARRVLRAEGSLCTVSLAHGQGPIGRFVSIAWRTAYKLHPMLVGGCRPIDMRSMLRHRGWKISYGCRVQQWGVTSEVIIAKPNSSSMEAGARA